MSQSEPSDLDPTTAAESYHDYSVDDEDQPVGLDNLSDVEGDVEDELDRGYSPPEKYSPAQGFGNTPYEEATGESLDQRIAHHKALRKRRHWHMDYLRNACRFTGAVAFTL